MSLVEKWGIGGGGGETGYQMRYIHVTVCNMCYWMGNKIQMQGSINDRVTSRTLYLLLSTG